MLIQLHQLHIHLCDYFELSAPSKDSFLSSMQAWAISILISLPLGVSREGV